MWLHSTIFARNLMGDILSYPELQEITLSLHDIDEERLATSEIVARNIASRAAEFLSSCPCGS